MTYKTVKPLFKYIGGKTWLREQLRNEVDNVLRHNPSIKSYTEPFAGGLGAFLGVYDVLLTHGVNKLVLSDVNANLIHLYKDIEKNYDKLLDCVVGLETEFANLIPSNTAKIKDKAEIKIALLPAQKYFNAIRLNFNQNKSSVSLEQSARLMFLQKHAFNGVYRENSRGEHNTPFNWSGADMSATVAQRLEDLKTVFSHFEIDWQTVSYDKLGYTADTLYYLDPPYLNTSTVENKYHQNSFNLNSQLDLIKKIEGLNFIYSNHFDPVVINALKLNNNIKIQSIDRKNTMSASAKSRSESRPEVLATHYIDKS